MLSDAIYTFPLTYWFLSMGFLVYAATWRFKRYLRMYLNNLHDDKLFLYVMVFIYMFMFVTYYIAYTYIVNLESMSYDLIYLTYCNFKLKKCQDMHY